MSDLPLEWLEVTFEQINFYQNQNINPLDFPNEVFELYSVPVFFTQKPEFLAGKEIGSSKLLVKKDDILVSKINPRINRVWQVHQFTDKKNIASSEWVVFRQNMAVPKFFKFYFESLKFRDLLCSNVSGVGGSLTRAQPKHIAKYILPRPPKAEQERIAELLDSHLAQVETIKTRLNAIFPIFKKFRQSVLADAVSGRLTEDWRLENKMDFDWEETTLGKAVNYGKFDKKQPDEIKENEWVLELEDIEKDSSKILNRLDNSVRKSKSTKNIFKKNDVLYGKLRPYLNKVVIADREGVCTTEIIPITPSKNILNYFLFIWLKSLFFISYVNQITYGVNMPRLGTSDGKNAPFRIPPIEEQNEIVERVEQLFAYADTIEIQLTHALQRVNQLTQSILHQAFTGKLTAHWRTQNPHLITGDNSATALLAQIQTAKQKATPTKKTKKVKNAD